MIAYYLQSRRPAALDRARALVQALGPNATVVSPRPAPFDWPVGWAVLDDDSAGSLSAWLRGQRPSLVLVDGSAEHLLAAREQVRTIAAVAGPGCDPDPTLGPAFDLADLVLAPWAAEAGPSIWPPAWEERTLHLGAIGWAASRALTGRSSRPRPAGRGAWRCLSIAPTAAGPGPRARRELLTETPAWQWSFAGERDLLSDGPVWDTLLRCDVVICSPTSTNLAALAAARVAAVLVVPDHPSEEHVFLAESARRTAPVVVVDSSRTTPPWRALLSRAHGLDGRGWSGWDPEPALGALRQLLGGEALPDNRKDEKMATGDVTTSYDGTAWTYEVEGDEPLGHSFTEKEPAVAGGRFLARQHGSLHTIQDQDGNVAEVHSYVAGPGG